MSTSMPAPVPGTVILPRAVEVIEAALVANAAERAALEAEKFAAVYGGPVVLAPGGMPPPGTGT